MTKKLNEEQSNTQMLQQQLLKLYESLQINENVISPSESSVNNNFQIMFNNHLKANDNSIQQYDTLNNVKQSEIKYEIQDDGALKCFLQNLPVIETKSIKNRDDMWTVCEQQQYLRAIKIYGYSNHQQVATEIVTKNRIQVLSHTQKYFKKLQTFFDSPELLQQLNLKQEDPKFNQIIKHILFKSLQDSKKQQETKMIIKRSKLQKDIPKTVEQIQLKVDHIFILLIKKTYSLLVFVRDIDITRQFLLYLFTQYDFFKYLDFLVQKCTSYCKQQ